jgi:hypothetical protein
VSSNFRTPGSTASAPLPAFGNLAHTNGTYIWKCNHQNMRQTSAPPEIGAPVRNKPGQWVQTERKAHEVWARFSLRKPTASALLHCLIAHMGPRNAVVIPQRLLAHMLGVTDRTIRTAVGDLVAENWIEVIRLGKGKEAAYVVNDRVVWGESRDKLCLSLFSATIVADAMDQDTPTQDRAPLRRIPTLYPGERQLPTGPGEEPPSQPTIPGMEPDLPALTEQEQLEAQAQKRLLT